VPERLSLHVGHETDWIKPLYPTQIEEQASLWQQTVAAIYGR
jgi:hypothetical protein